MTRNASLLVVAAMMVGSLGAMGCKSNDSGGAADKGAIAPEETPETAPVSEAAGNALSFGVEGNHTGASVHFWGGRPPAARWEDRGRAPSDRHFWSPGYYRWNGREHVWNRGGWYARRDGYDYIAPHWQNAYGRWEYLPGRWHRRW